MRKEREEENKRGAFGNRHRPFSGPQSMLYQTHHPFFFQFHLSPSSFPPTSSLPSALLFRTPPPPLVQGEMEMECAEAALRTNCRKQIDQMGIPQAIIEDLWALNVQNGAPSDDFFVDELLDFSNEEEALVYQVEEEEQQEEQGSSGFLEEENQTQDSSVPSSSLSAKDNFVSLPTGELTFPAEDLAHLEWLSHFVEDSFSEHSTAYPAGVSPVKPENQAKKGSEPEYSVPVQPCFKIPFPAKARSKRQRTRSGIWVWSLGSPSLTESSSSSTSSSSSSFRQSLEQVCPDSKHKPAKKPNKNPGGESTGNPRRCCHCGVQKTPQWRTGPLGAKTLCNACGVRYKSGRLLPEYRPACSPTFSSELHSNHHRRVLEMRRKKELMAVIEAGLSQ